jgi:hypothetical protein
MPPRAKPSAAALLDLLVERAPGLREVGVRRVELAGLAFELAEPRLTLEQGPSRADVQLADEMDPLMDPATYGRSDGRVPGFTRPERDEDDN